MLPRPALPKLALPNLAPAALAVAALATTCLLPSDPAAASPYDALYAFGDSLTDNGNLADVAYHQNFPNPPSYHDSFTNGPVAVQALALSMGLTLNPSLWVTSFQDPHSLFGGASFVPGTNYAVAGATASPGAINAIPGINLPTQVAAYGAFSFGAADPNALYVVMIGGNDVRDAALYGGGTAAITAAVNTELAALTTLAGLGAKNFLVVNVPNVGIIPEFAQQNPADATLATTYSQLYDSELAAGLASLGLPAGDTLTPFDLYGYNNAIIANAASYGLTNTTDPCFINTPLSAATTPACAGGQNIGSFAYWDSIHPTAKVHALWAQGFEQALGVPEPASAAILAAGAVLAVTRRRRPIRAAPV